MNEIILIIPNEEMELVVIDCKNDFYNKVSKDLIDDSLNDKLSDNEKKIYKLIKEKGKIKIIKDISTRLNISTATVQRALNKMTELNVVERIGSRKIGYWIVNDK